MGIEEVGIDKWELTKCELTKWELTKWDALICPQMHAHHTLRQSSLQ